MKPTQTLIHVYENNHDIIRRQLQGITHEESLLQPPFRGNCLNWVVGHILGIRSQCLGFLGLPGLLSEAEQKVYGYGSEPLTCPDNASELDSLVKRLDQSLGMLTAALDCLSPAELEREVRIWRGPMPLSEAIGFMQWHESYHTGQLELLRQLAGKNDHII